ncbi:hypothetical protein DICPUDRAFT_50700 [Dictyostelium purpureum]|uniref:Beta-lactamase-related domain-containing protein n=1 Tax=Dictyostelium purpureum TaxID=5786 RepID=F0ZZR7_DICPU|nr:uncharacterized protein DICPUDRAFT_50700 [Dictyostelium purpureum]EGC30566.1 hypothetical protein DICPUDRAFT_50700 [Dictyostelium purpureum]|eukprot:XP_003292907.1 hypothetical protein DICPUDRAFT_50700 [Dictyostelium purpureum]
MKIQFILILFLFYICTTLVISCPDYPEPIEIDQNNPTLQKAYAEVDSIIQAGMKANGVKSFIASIVYRDQIVWSKTYGNVNPLDPKSPPLTLDNAVRIASISKTFTDLMMFQLRDKGIVSLDDPVSKHFPEFTIGNLYNTKKEITLRELASHSSGLGREVPCNYDELPDLTKCSEQVIIERLSKMFVILPTYKTIHYSNLGLALLGRTLEKAANTQYEKYVHEKIFYPLGMHNSSCYYDDVKDILAQGVDLWPNGSYSIAPVEGLGWGTPMGGIYSTARDMSKYMAFWLNNEFDDHILDPSTHNEALSAVQLVNDGVNAYGTPFEMFYDSENQIWTKNKAGQLDGYRTQMSLIKPLKLGLFFSSLLAFETEDVFTRAATQVLVPAYEAVLREANSKPQSYEETIPSFSSIKHSKPPQKIPDHAFVGFYENSEGSVFIVDNSTGSLLASFGDNVKYNMSAFSEDYPEILRIQVVQTPSYPCWFVVDGSNYELVYFTLNSEDYLSSDLTCNGVTAMGQKMNLVSKNPNYSSTVKLNRPPRSKFL